MKIIFASIFTIAVLGTASHAQPVLVSGFNGMASVNGATYSHTGTVGDPSGGYAFVAASGDRTKFFATSFSKQYLYFIDPATFTITDSMNHVVYTLCGSTEPNTLFARTDAGLCRINTVSKTITDSVAIPNGQFVKERPNAKEVWVTSDNKVYVVDYTTGLTATPFTVTPVTTDNGEISFTRGGTLAYKVAWTSKKVYKINAATKAITDSFSTGISSPSGIALSADSSKVFISFPGDKKVRVYATATMSIIDSINCGTREPFDLYRHPDRAEIWVVNHFKDSITVYNEATYAQIAAFDVSSSPHSIAFGIGATAAPQVKPAINSIIVYPNPAKERITIIGINVGDRVNIYNATGQSRYNALITTDMLEVTTKAFAPGTYFIFISDEHGIQKGNYSIIKQ